MQPTGPPGAGSHPERSTAATTAVEGSTTRTAKNRQSGLMLLVDHSLLSWSIVRSFRIEDFGSAASATTTAVDRSAATVGPGASASATAAKPSISQPVN